MKKIKYLILILLCCGAIIFVFDSYKTYFMKNTSFSSETVYLKIPSNTTKAELLDSLSNYLIDLGTFEKAANKKEYLLNIKAGRFLIKKDYNNNEIINSLRSNNIPVQVTFNNIETLNKLAATISKKIEADSASIVMAFNEIKFLNDLNLNEESVFSLFIPNTYEFFWNTDAIRFRERVVKEFDKFWNDNRVEKAKKINLNPIEVMVLASIVQKETPKVDERPTIAGVYLNRLRKNMKLQADPTVVYSIKQKQGFDKVIRRVLYKDLRIKSKYNTYYVRGLPPGPIVTPDISSIESVINYSSNSFLFFVADVSNPGYHLFSRTLSEHNKKKRQYTKWLKERNIRR